MPKGAWAFIKSSLPTNQRGRRIASDRGKGLATFRGTVTTSSFMKLGRHVACGFAQFVILLIRSLLNNVPFYANLSSGF